MLETAHDFSEETPATQRWVSFWLVSIIVGICILAQIINYQIIVNDTAQELASWRIVLIALADFLPWIVVAPIIVWSSKKYPPVELRAIFLFHLPVGVISAVLVLIFSTFARHIFEPNDVVLLNKLFFRVFYNFTSAFIFYWFLVGAFFTVDYHFSYREKASKELRLIAEKAKLEQELVSTRLDALHAQFKPHFLFNALHTVSALMERDVTQARAALVKISGLLRSALQFTDIDKHPLSAEIAWLTDYISIERIRYSQKLTFDTDIEDSLEQFLLPPLILQPIVENAIHHAAGKNGGSACIVLTATTKPTGVEIIIDDNGPGFSATSNAEGYGINLVRGRLRLLGEGSNTLELGASPSGGARVKFSFSNLSETIS